MGGKSKSATVGYWYKVLYHGGLGAGPIDAFLEFRGGDKTAWKGELTASGTISVNAPNLWGGEKDQGGIVGAMDVMFGEATQEPNEYLLANLGSQVSAWRGLATVVFKGGKYGAMNPYPQKASYKLRKITKGWDDDECWYPEKAAVPFASIAAPYDGIWAYKVEAPGSTADYSAADYDDSAWPQGPGGFGSIAPPGSTLAVNTPIPGQIGKAIWIRRRVSFVGLVTIAVYHDDGAWLWVDGSPVDLTYVSYFHSTAQVMLSGDSVIALKVVDGMPSGSPNIFAGMAFSGGTQDKLAANPAHVLYYARTNAEIGREPIANLSDESYRAAADRLFDEGFGICTSYDPSAESLEEFEQRICRVIGGSVSRSLIDGKWYLDLARGDYVLEDLPVLTDDDILGFSEQPTVLDGSVNSVSIKYFDPVKKEDVVTSPIQALALIDAFGTVHQTNEYPEIPTADLAARVGDRDVRAFVTPTRAFELTTTRKTYGWRPNQYFRLQAPKRGIADMVCILGEKQSGTLRSGAIRIKAAQDIYGMPDTSFVEVEPGVDTRPPQTPIPITQQRAMEAPYVEVVRSISRADLDVLPPETGYLMAMADDPAISRDYSMRVSPDGVTYTDAGDGEWCPTALVIEAASFTETAFTLASGERLDEVAVGSVALWDDELVRVDALDPGAGTLVIGRGCADTVPAQHAAGSRIWFYMDNIAADIAEYTAGETIQVKLLTNTGSQQLNEVLATPIPVSFVQRQFRPYPPAKFRVNGEVAPPSLSGEVTLTWAHRDRVLQADQLVDNEATDVGPEPGTTYTARWYLNDILIHTEPSISGATVAYTPPGGGILRIELESERDGVASFQAQVRELSLGSPLLTESGALITTEDDQPILME